MDHYSVFGYNGFCIRNEFWRCGTTKKLIFEKKYVGDAFLNTTLHGIDTGNAKPICCKKSSYEFWDSKIIIKQIKKLIKKRLDQIV